MSIQSFQLGGNTTMWFRVSSLLAAVVFLLSSATSRASVQVYAIEDIATFGQYRDYNTNQSFAGTGFVGMYNDSFAHLFGLEQNDFSKTALQVDIAGLAGAVINSATLSFDLLNGSNASQTATVTSFIADGTLEHFWNAPSNLGAANYTVDGQNSNYLDVTSFLQERVNADADWLGLHLQGSDVYQWTYTNTTTTRDAANVRLTVDYTIPDVAAVPEATSILAWTMVLGGIGLIAYKRQMFSGTPAV